MIDKANILKEISSDQKNLPPFRTVSKLLVSDFPSSWEAFQIYLSISENQLCC